MKRTISAVVVLIGLAAPAWAGFDEGVAAYNRGDYATALHEWRPLAKQGDAAAQFNLGLMYETGQGVPQNYVQAVRWYRTAADQGYASAQSNLGLLYADGQGVTQDYAEAVRWYRKAADQGTAQAHHNVGLMYYNGQGVTQDYVQAHMWYTTLLPQVHPLVRTATAPSRTGTLLPSL